MRVEVIKVSNRKIGYRGAGSKKWGGGGEMVGLVHDQRRGKVH
jgi:hypothetical protein